MIHAPQHPHEAERLQTLRDYQILDTPPEAAFDRITTLAAKMLRAPLALVSLIEGDRQWMKACFGHEVVEVSRGISFCAHTILRREVMVVEDTLLDPRFSTNPQVTGSPYIRFYAGAPITAPDGQNVGSFCVLDTVPRAFTDDEKETLADLAAIVVDEMELRRTARALREREAKLRESLKENSQLAIAIDQSRSGIVITDPDQPDNPIVFANPHFYAITHYSPAEIIGRNCRFLQGPETDPAAVQEIRDSIAARRPFDGVLLNYRKDGIPFVNELSVNPVFDEDGRLLSFVGLQNDVTEREQARELLEQRVRERTADLAESQVEILSRLARAAELRDDDTGQHTQRVAHTAGLLAERLGLPPEQVALIRDAAPLHDVGKIGVSDLILLKPGKLTDEEFAIMKTHAPVGAELLSDGRSETVRMAERIAGAHHERWDGNGYPHQMAGDQIPLEGRILAVADVFDALTHERPYKKAWSLTEAVAEIERQSGHHFDPAVVKAFRQLRHEELL